MTNVIRPWPVDYSDIDLSWMAGRAISEISVDECANWCFSFEPGVFIGIDCLWRIVEHGRIALTSEDHGHKFGLPAPIDAAAKASESLLSATIRAVNLHDATADIYIDFTDDLSLEIIPTSSGYESWQLRDPFGSTFYAQGGGQICRWTS